MIKATDEKDLERALELNSKIAKGNKKSRTTALKEIEDRGGIEAVIDIWNNNDNALLLEMIGLEDSDTAGYYTIYVSPDGNSWKIDWID